MYVFIFTISIIELTEYGYMYVKKEEEWEVLWDTHENITQAQQKVDAVLNGCRCRTGCHTRRCSCRKHNNCCGPGCRCIGCDNTMPTSEEKENEAEDEIEIEDLTETQLDQYTDDSEDDSHVQAKEIDNIMLSIFGEDSDDGIF